MAKLRAAENSQPKNHHFCTFNSGIALGLALPAFISGVYQSRLTFLILWALLLNQSLTQRFPTGTAGTDPTVGCLVIYLRHPFCPSAIFSDGRYQHVSLVECKDQLCVHIWFVRCVSYYLIWLSNQYRTRRSDPAGPLWILWSRFCDATLTSYPDHELRSRQSCLQLSLTHSGCPSLTLLFQPFGRLFGWVSPL